MKSKAYPMTTDRETEGETCFGSLTEDSDDLSYFDTADRWADRKGNERRAEEDVDISQSKAALWGNEK